MGYISSATILSTITGLGTIGYLSTPSLVSTISSMGNHFKILSAAVSSLNASNVYSVQGYISSLRIDTLTLGDGTGWADFGAIRAVVVSTLEIDSGIIYGTTISSARFVGDGSMLSNLPVLSLANLTSTSIGLGTLGYLSSAITNLSSIISTPQLTSSLIGLGSIGYVSTTQLTSTAQGLTGYINSFIDPQELASSITGLGTLQFISSIGLLSTSQGLANYITSFIDPQELASTVIGLGTARYVSTSVISTNAIFTSSLIGLGSMAYLSSVPSTFISSAALFSSLRALGSMGYISSGTINVISTPQLFSSLIGLGTLGYLSSSALCSFSTSLANPLGNFNVMSTGRTTASTITFFDTLNSNAVTDIYVRSTLLYFGGNVIGGTKVAQPQFFTF